MSRFVNIYPHIGVYNCRQSGRRSYNKNLQPRSKRLWTLDEIRDREKLCQINSFYLLKKLGDVVIRGRFGCPLLSQAVGDCVELKLECIPSTPHRGGKGKGRCLNLTSYCVSVPRLLTRSRLFKGWIALSTG